MTPQGVAAYLVEMGLLRTEELVEVGIILTLMPGRNTSVKVVTGRGGCLFVKQASEGEIDTIAREADVYGRFEEERNRRPALGHVPRRLWYDSGRGLLVLEGTADHIDLDTHVARRRVLDAPMAEDIGSALG